MMKIKRNVTRYVLFILAAAANHEGRVYLVKYAVPMMYICRHDFGMEESHGNIARALQIP